MVGEEPACSSALPRLPTLTCRELGLKRQTQLWAGTRSLRKPEPHPRGPGLLQAMRQDAWAHLQASAGFAKVSSSCSQVSAGTT